MRKKYLHIIASVDPAQGGPIEGLKQLSGTITPMGWDVEVASLDGPNEPYVHDFPLPLHTLGPAQAPYRYTPRLVPWLRAHVHDYDVVILNGIWTYSSFGAYRVLQSANIPYIVFTHGMLDPYFKEFRLKHIKKCLYWPWTEYRVLRDAAAVCFTCDEERLLARQSFSPYRCNEVVVNYGTAGPPQGKEQEVRQRAAFLDNWPQLKGKRFLLFLSRIHPKKGCDLLIDAFAKISRLYPDLHLVIAGPDQTGWQRSLEVRAAALLGEGVAAERIIWTGVLWDDKKWGAFRLAEAFVLPSHQENFGIVVAEALACETPVLITDKVNIWREVQADGAGLVEPDTADGVTRLLTRWLTLSIAERSAIRMKAKTCFLSRFEIQKAGQSLLEVLKGFSNKNTTSSACHTPFRSGSPNDLVKPTCYQDE